MKIRNARLEASTCLVSILSFCCGVAVPFRDAAKHFLFCEGFKRGRHVMSFCVADGCSTTDVFLRIDNVQMVWECHFAWQGQYLVCVCVCVECILHATSRIWDTLAFTLYT